MESTVSYITKLKIKMMRRVIVLILVCVMSLISAQQQSLSPNQSLRTAARFAEAKGFQTKIADWRNKAKKNYCAMRALVKKGSEKYPIAFFAAKTGMKIGAKALIGIATLGVSEVITDAAAVAKSTYDASKDMVESLVNIKTSPLTTSAKMACGTVAMGKSLGAIIKDGVVAFIEAETGVNIADIAKSATSELEAARTEVKGLVSEAAGKLSPGFAAIHEKIEGDAANAAKTAAESYVGFSCDKLCMLTKRVDQGLQQDVGLAPNQNYCELPDTFIIGRFRCMGGASTPVEGSNTQHRNGMACTVMEGLEEAGSTEEYMMAAMEGWVTIAEGEMSDAIAADYGAAQTTLG